LMKQLTEDLAKGAGNSIAINQAAEVEVHQIGHDMDKLLDQRDKNYREEIRQLQVPVILFDPDILNRATSQELMEAWTVSVLKGYRSWLADIIQDQWLNPIVKKMIENERDAARTGTDTQEPQAEERLTLSQSKTEAGDKGKAEASEESTSGNNPNLVPTITKELIPIEAIDPTTGEVLVYRLPWKIKLEFEALNYDTFKEKVESSILLKNNGLATTATALKRIGVTDENEIAQLLEMEEERRIQNQQLAAAQIAKQQSGERSPGALPAGEGQAGAPQQPQQQGRGAKPRTLERQRQKMREELRQSVSGNNTPTNRKGNIIGGRKRPIPTK
jgi:hypothetical protein